MGYDTIVGERPSEDLDYLVHRNSVWQLQEQLLVLLDEASSALDAESEKVVQDA
ncbi:hypothetical protein A2U01_0038458, partial [Trifolium medium]|nr:hypothetical protein [Trifolium medium]